MSGIRRRPGLSDHRGGPAGVREAARADSKRHHRPVEDRFCKSLAGRAEVSRHSGTRRCCRGKAALSGTASGRGRVAGVQPFREGGRHRYSQHRLRPVEDVRDPSDADGSRHPGTREPGVARPAAADGCVSDRVAHENRWRQWRAAAHYDHLQAGERRRSHGHILRPPLQPA